jgi:hypothetical protein
MRHVEPCASGLRAAPKRTGGRVIGLWLACWEASQPGAAHQARSAGLRPRGRRIISLSVNSAENLPFCPIPEPTADPSRSLP